MISSIISRLVILVFGTLYPAYASYKAVRTKNLKEYVKWMMYWIVFALFTCTETFTDMFLSWFPFYYEVKIVLVLWLLSPATKGSSILYRKFVHPALCRREQEIDEYIAKAKDQGYHTVLNLGTKGVNYATTVIMQTAIKGGGGLVQQLRKSYSLSDLTECEPHEERQQDEADDVLSEPRLIRRNTAKTMYNTRRSTSESNSRSPMYFSEVDVDVKSNRTSRSDEPDFSHVKSSEDISSGYSSADNSAAPAPRGAAAAGAGGAARRGRAGALTAVRRAPPAEGSEVIIEELHDDDNFEYTNMPPLLNVPSPLFLSHTNPPFVYQCIGDQIKIVQVLEGNINVNASINLDQHVDLNNSKIELTESDPSTNNDEFMDVEITESEASMSFVSDNSVNIPIASYPKENKCDDTKLKDMEIKKNDDTLTTNLDVCEIANNDSVIENTDKTVENTVSLNLETLNSIINKETLESTSLDTCSLNDRDSVDSDDEASFGTPEDSPKSRRKSPKIGKYGKAKAPQPPQTTTNNNDNKHIHKENNLEHNPSNIVNYDTDLKETPTISKTMHYINPIAEKKRRHKSKSPAKITKTNSSTIGKLLQIPGKFAFWHKNDDKGKCDNSSLSSDDQSRRSSTVERNADNFQSCADLSSLNNEACAKVELDQISFKDAMDVEGEAISQNILYKSDELQKLIEAKLESHPEYKTVSLHDEEIPSGSKSTDV